MASPKAPTKNDHMIAAVFHDTDAFLSALEALLKAGFDRAAVSVLADHDALKDHFGVVPDAETLADRQDTPREDLDTQGALKHAIAFIAESVAILGEIGAAGAAYAVGGPVGVATGTSTVAEHTVSQIMSDYTNDQYRARFDQSVRVGGIVCWVHARTRDEARRAEKILTETGGDHVHEVAW